jgi:hypothetical protein
VLGINIFDNGRNPIGGVPCNEGLRKNWIKKFLKENEVKLQFFIKKYVIIERIYHDKRLMHIFHNLNVSLKIMIRQSNILSSLYALNEYLYPKRWYFIWRIICC